MVMPSSSPTSHKISFSYGDIAKFFLLHIAYYCIEVLLSGQHNSKTVFVYILYHGLIFLPGILLMKQRHGVNSRHNAPRVTGSMLLAEYFRNTWYYPLIRASFTFLFQLGSGGFFHYKYVMGDSEWVAVPGMGLSSSLEFLEFLGVITFERFFWRCLHFVVGILDSFGIVFCTIIGADAFCMLEMIRRLHDSEANRTTTSTRINGREVLLQTSFGTLGLLSSWIFIDRKMSRIPNFAKVYDLVIVIITYFSVQALLAFDHVEVHDFGRLVPIAGIESNRANCFSLLVFVFIATLSANGMPIAGYIERLGIGSNCWHHLKWLVLVQWLYYINWTPSPFAYLQESDGEFLFFGFHLLRIFLRLSLCVMLARKTWKRYKTFSAEEESHSHES